MVDVTDADDAWIHGDAPSDVSMPFPVPIDDLASYVPAFNANGAVNAIPYVCAAPPGAFSRPATFPTSSGAAPVASDRGWLMAERRESLVVTGPDMANPGPLTRTVLEYEQTMKRLQRRREDPPSGRLLAAGAGHTPTPRQPSRV